MSFYPAVDCFEAADSSAVSPEFVSAEALVYLTAGFVLAEQSAVMSVDALLADSVLEVPEFVARKDC